MSHKETDCDEKGLEDSNVNISTLHHTSPSEGEGQDNMEGYVTDDGRKTITGHPTDCIHCNVSFICIYY